MHKAIIIGRIAKEPETVGNNIVIFVDSCEESIRPGSTEVFRERLEIMLSSKLSASIGSFLEKGRMAYIEGMIRNKKSLPGCIILVGGEFTTLQLIKARSVTEEQLKDEKEHAQQLKQEEQLVQQSIQRDDIDMNYQQTAKPATHSHQPTQRQPIDDFPDDIPGL
jgi:single-stranded DNA-binding protein